MSEHGSGIARQAAAIGAVALAGLLAAPPAQAAENEEAVAACIDAVGTYLTRNLQGDGSEAPLISRSLLSLTNGGHAFFTDSGESGGTIGQAFSEGRGAWRCLSNTGGKAKFTALILEFTFPGPDETEQHIVRLDINASFDSPSETLEGTTRLSLVPLEGDPFDPAALADSVEYNFTGRKVDAP